MNEKTQRITLGLSLRSWVSQGRLHPNPQRKKWGSTQSSIVVTPSQTHGLKAMVGIFVAAIADVHEAQTDLRFVVEAVHDIERGSEVKTSAQGANAVVPLDG